MDSTGSQNSHINQWGKWDIPRRQLFRYEKQMIDFSEKSELSLKSSS